MKKLIIFASVLLLVVLLLGTTLALTSSSAPEIQAQQEKGSQENFQQQSCRHQYAVYIENGNFYPATLEVHVGDSVIWINKDQENHLVSLESCGDHLVPAEGSEEFTFTQPGVFSYLYGEGSVVVQR